MAQMSLEDLYRGEGAGEKYGILGELMKDFFKNGCPLKYDVVAFYLIARHFRK